MRAAEVTKTNFPEGGSRGGTEAAAKCPYRAHQAETTFISRRGMPLLSILQKLMSNPVLT